MNRKQRLRQRAPQAGFTLLELLVVLVILGLLASLVGPQILRHVGTSKTQTAALQINELSSALDLYRLEVGHYPSTDEGLDALIKAPSGASNWHGPYLSKSVLRKDPWGNDYHYKFPGEHGPYDLYSLGADNREGGDGENQDVTNWQ